ncbi:MFS transporter [uncultured Nocardioides sp.]|uniref:MFS transporter n=1 Tax=uncultured Nocardioides sp. TaxID=198441 RepID=UPI002606C896|nr:MFS transporter [uncultured Nocardioides sp.]
MTTSGTAPSVREELFGPDRRGVTVGLVLLISLVAFEAMGVGTAMPALVADLGDVSDYSWPFVAFGAATVVGTVAAGRWCDVHGPKLVLLGAPVLFGAGLLVAATAPTLPVLLVGRVLQGAGAGAQGVAVYVLIALVYSVGARPAVFALISSAWVVPSLVGPPVAGLLAEQASWRWVFGGLLPLVVLAVALIARTAVRQGAPANPRPGRRGLLPGALAAAVAVAAISWVADHTTYVGVAVGLVALAVLVPAVRLLVPAGTLVARPGVAAVVAGRGLLSGAFFTATAFMPLLLTEVHGWSLTAAGIPLIVGSLGWSASSAWQGRRPELSRPALLRAGFVCVGTAIAGLLLVAPAWGVPWLAVPLWALAGTGMGLGFSSLSYLLLAHSAPEDTGFHSSAAQLGDQLSQAVVIGVGGGLVAVLAGVSGGLAALFVLLLVMALAGVAVSGRTALRA